MRRGAYGPPPSCSCGGLGSPSGPLRVFFPPAGVLSRRRMHVDFQFLPVAAVIYILHGSHWREEGVSCNMINHKLFENEGFKKNIIIN